MDCSTPGFPVHQLLELAQTNVHWVMMSSDHFMLCRPLLLPPSIFPSIRVFSNESVLYIGWPKYWSCSINPSNECSGLISFKIDGFDILAVQGTLKSLLQHNSKASILRCSTFFMDQLSHLYMPSGKTVALTIGPLSAKWCLCFLIHHVSRFVIAFLPRSKCLLISWLLIEKILGENNKIFPPYPQAQPLCIKNTQKKFF